MFKIDSFSKFNKLYASFIILIIILFVGITLYIDQNILIKIQNVEKIELKYQVKQKEILSNKVNRIIEYINFTKTDIDSTFKIELRSRVNEAYSISMNLYENYKDKLSNNDLKELIKESLRPIRYNDGKGYYFLVSMSGVEQLYPVKPEFEGKNILNLQDVKGKYVIKEEINIVKQKGEGFVDGYWYKPNESKDEAFLKLTFVKYFEPFDWYIGSGGYLDNVNDNLKEKVLKRIRQIDENQSNVINNETNIFTLGISNDDFNNEENFNLLNDTAYDGNLYVYELLKVGGGNNFAKKIFMLKKFTNSDGKISKFLKDQYISTDLKDLNDTLFVKKLFNEMKTSGYAFGSYYDQLNKNNEIIKINTFVKYYPEWKWIIATTQSFDDINIVIENVKNRELLKSSKEKIELFTFSIIIVILVLIFSTFLSRTMNKDFKKFYNFFHKASTFEGSIESDQLIFSEFKDLSSEANKMIELFKESNRNLKNNENQFRTFINQADEFMIIKDIQGRYIKVNKKFCDLLKLEEKDIINKRPSEVGYDIDTSKKMDDVDIEVLKHKKIIINEKKSILAKSIGTKWLEESVFPICDDKGKIIYIGIVSRDITRRKLAEQDLIKKHKELESAYINLKKGNEIIIEKEKLASLGTFTAGIAHEINNPTQAIKFSMNSLNLNLIDINELLKDLSNIESSFNDNEKIKKIDKIIEKIENFELKEMISEINSTIDENLQSLKRIKNIINSTRRMAYNKNEFTKVSINEIVKDSLNLVNNEIKYIAKIDIDLEENIPEINCLDQEIGQVFINCLLNSRDSIIEKKLSIDKSKIIVKSTFDKNNQEIILSIIDNGIGIKKENIKKIFDPFYTTKEIGKGAGLGLNLSHQIILNHNGRIEVDSKDGSMTEFKIILPLT